jgi:type 1 glutamine amidotransferase
LVFSRTAGFRHTSIESGIDALRRLADQHGWQITATEDPTTFTDAGLATFDVMLFLSTTGEVLDETQQAAMERFIRTGHGYVGVHAASDTEYEWPWYGALVGAYFLGHPPVQTASILVEPDTIHPAVLGLVSPWRRTDEWYAFQANPRDRVHVLLHLDETSYDAGDTAMGEDHPIAWYHEYDGGRAFYTALGHTDESYQESLFLAHLAGGIEWAIGTR